MHANAFLGLATPRASRPLDVSSAAVGDGVKPRIEIVDAIRGSALMGILLLHSVEHFDFLAYPPFPPAWVRPLDRNAHDIAFYLFSGKSYAIFALMFGLSFFLLLDRAAQRGVNFRWRFLWRLGLLGLIGYAHSLVYCGDILTILAVLGLPLVALYGLSNRVLAWIAGGLLVQLPFLYYLVRLWFDPTYHPAGGHAGAYYRLITPSFAQGTFLDVVRSNVANGQLAKWWWMWDNGRCLQMMGLFVCGLLLGRNRVFEDPAKYVRLAKLALLIGLAGYGVLYLVDLKLQGLPRNPVRRVSLDTVRSYTQLAQMLVWIGGFILLYAFTKVRPALRLLVPYGRTSLTCYVTQALIWVPLYYNFGLGLYRHLGVFFSILAGALFFVAQLALAHAWLRRFHYGPLEWIWRCGTMLSWKSARLQRTPGS